LRSLEFWWIARLRMRAPARHHAWNWELESRDGFDAEDQTVFTPQDPAGPLKRFG